VSTLGASVASTTQVELPSGIPLQRGDDEWITGRSAAALVLLAALLCAVLYAARRLRRDGPGRLGGLARRERPLLKVVASQRLSAHSTLHVIDYEGRRLLIADGSQGATCLIDEPRAAEAAQPGSANDVA
jgi:flagellar biogenesis protein FliO